MARFYSPRQKRVMQIKQGNLCRLCGKPLTQGFHGDHRRPYSKGGPTIVLNGQVLCPTCNLKKGTTMSTPNIALLRQWQSECHDKAMARFMSGHREFYINACPASGKTIAATVTSFALIDSGMVERVIIVAPTNEIVSQWSKTFQRLTGRTMLKVTGSDMEVSSYGTDICVTCASVGRLSEALASICSNERVLVIVDEVHHNAENAAWGLGSIIGLSDAVYALILSGTLERSDDERPIWLQYNDDGHIDLDPESSYTLTYGQAITEGYCRPVTFHRHEGKFHVHIDTETTIEVNAADDPAEIEKKLGLTGLRNALDFYRLACIPQYENDNETPNLNGYQCSMLSEGIEHLNNIRQEMPNAGGLIICPSIQMAEYMSKLIELVESSKPIIVHSEIKNSSARIRAYREGTQRWIVSVNMIAEGVDVPRLRVLVYLPSALTELFFRQAIGRIIRSIGIDDTSSGYVIMPATNTFDEYAKRIESEIPAQLRPIREIPTERICPKCNEPNSVDAKSCRYCEYDFQLENTQPLKSCPQCDTQNNLQALTCFNCGWSFTNEYDMTLAEALRDGAIVRGMQLTEDEVRLGEANCEKIKEAAFESGDALLIAMLNQLPKEAYGRLVKIMSKVQKDTNDS